MCKALNRKVLKRAQASSFLMIEALPGSRSEALPPTNCRSHSGMAGIKCKRVATQDAKDQGDADFLRGVAKRKHARSG